MPHHLLHLYEENEAGHRCIRAGQVKPHHFFLIHHLSHTTPLEITVQTCVCTQNTLTPLEMMSLN